MSRCPKCQTDYPEHVIVCPVEGEVLHAEVRRVEQRTSGFDDTVALQAITVADAIAMETARAPAMTVPNDAVASTTDQAVAVGSPVATPPDRALAMGSTMVLPQAAAPALAAFTGMAAPDDGLPPGFKVGEYEVARHIGSGGMATVYAGIQPVIGKEVAIKVLSRSLSRDRSMVDRFVQEARAVNQIRHHNIVDIFALGELPDGRAYCVMELLTGETLKDRLGRGAPSYEETISILSQLCEGLDAAHRANVVHRDLKPDNVFLVATSRGPLVKILDFGIAKLLDAKSQPRQQTSVGILMGTPEYMSPEQCSGREVDARTDIYLLGVMLYEVFTGKLPFAGRTPIETISAHVTEAPADPGQHAELPPKLRELILACLAKEPADRPQSALQVRDRMLDVVRALGLDPAQATMLPAGLTPAGTPIVRTPPGLVRPRPRRKLALVAGGAAVLAAAVSAIVIGVAGGDDRATTTPPAASLAGTRATAPELALQVISVPAGASVTIGGQPQRLRTPYVYKVAWSDRMTVRVELPGHKPVEQDVQLATGELEKLLEIKLEPDESAVAPDPLDRKPEAAAPRFRGSPAVITDLALDPAVAWVGKKTTVTGTIKFEDQDADVVTIKTDTAGRGTQSTPLPVSGASKGTAAFTFVITPTTVGPQTIEVWVQDRGDNRSNRLSGTIEVMEPDKGAAPPVAPEIDAAPPEDSP